MTGWRLGWMVVPDAMVPVVERLAQNLFICASTVSQHAALACFEAREHCRYTNARRAEFKARRDYFHPCTAVAGAWRACDARWRLSTPGPTAPPLSPSWACKAAGSLPMELMEPAHLAITPGRDFGSLSRTARYVRFSTANSMEQLQEAVARMRKLFA